ncbi:MAG: cation-translocating P-type ATPase [Lachnospiraceae bacterium]
MQDFHTCNAKCAAAYLGSNLQKGLTRSERRTRLETYGYNRLPQSSSGNVFIRFLSQFKNFMILILLLAAGLSLFASYLEGKPDFTEPAIILAILILNALLGTFQEVRARKALSALKKRQSRYASVLIDGEFEQISGDMLVPGDIIELRQGLIVPADARIITSSNLIVNESAFTGESLPVEKNPLQILKPETPLADRKNMVYSSTIICSGHGTAIVTATGANAEIGKIAHMLNNDKAPETPLMIRMNSISRVLGLSCIGICLIIFLIGLYQKTPLLSMFLTSISLAVASIPEGLPAVVTIMLSIGVMRLAKQRAIMRNLASVETLGKAGVICSDKTGTLTMNKMTLVNYATIHGCYSFPSGKAALSPDCIDLLISAKINCTATKSSGDATEKAILAAAEGLSVPNHKKIDEIPFSSKRKAMVTISQQENKIIIYLKGAFDRVLPLCDKIYSGNNSSFSDVNTLPADDIRKSILNRCHQKFSGDALRVIAVAKRELSKESYLSLTSGCRHLHGTEYEEKLFRTLSSGFTFLGLLAFLDPPRPEVKSAIAKASRAGIKTVMITGDHADTAKAIAEKIGISSLNTMTGEELDAVNDEKLRELVKNTCIFARVSPVHKVRLVKAFQSNGMRVIMTGDGINDAPALKVADIGAAMGMTGTDVAREASDMILTDDNYATIVEAIAGGRGIYDNIKKSIHFLLSCNTGEILTVLFALIFGLNAPLAAIQLLWINLITDSLPAIALGMEKPSDDVFNHAARYQREAMFDLTMIIRIVLEGALIAGLSLIAYLCYGSTGCFIVLGMSELLHSFDLRSSGSIFSKKQANPFVLLSFILCSILQLGVAMHPKLAGIFGLTLLGRPALLTLLIFSTGIILVSEVEKLIFNSTGND